MQPPFLTEMWRLGSVDFGRAALLNDTTMPEIRLSLFSAHKKQKLTIKTELLCTIKNSKVLESMVFGSKDKCSNETC